jgi:hypothetical protein
MTVQWPPIPTVTDQDPQAEVKKILYQAQLDYLKAEHEASIALDKARKDAEIESVKREATADIERERADWANEYSQAQAVNSTYLEIAKGALDRGTAKATYVQTAALAISGIYTGLLGLAFTVTGGRFLPARGVVPGLFLGLAIFLAAIYVSFITKPEDVSVSTSGGTLAGLQRQRRNNLVVWTRAPALRRRKFLRASILSLGAGVLLLPLAFLDISPDRVIALAGLGAVAVGGVALFGSDDG